MKEHMFDMHLIATRPENYSIRTDFTDQVMDAIQSSEILSDRVRKMNVNKKETFIMKLHHLPKLAVLVIAIGSLVILSGVAYASYQLLWPKPEVHTSGPTTSASGRQAVAISLAQCGGSKLGSRYELKKNATITVDEIPMVVKAQCELGAIDTWARATFPNNDTQPPKGLADGMPYDRVTLSTSMATHIKSRSDSSMTFAGLTKYNQPDTTLSIAPETQFIADGHAVLANAITANDPIAYVTSSSIHFQPNGECNNQQCNMSGNPTSSKLVAVVKLSQPFQYYDQLAWQSLTEIVACEGNPHETCLTGYAGAIDLYQAFENTDPGARMKEVQGFVTSIDGPSVTIKSSSGSLFTITTPTDVISSYNKNKASQYYNNQTVRVGSGLDIRYMESPDQHSKSINGKSIISMQLQIEVISKASPVTAY